MANTCEPLINVVRADKPKMLRRFRKKLIGLSQKARGQVQGVVPPLPQTKAPPANRRSLTPSMVCAWNVTSP
jgi:hypothetical protein